MASDSNIANLMGLARTALLAGNNEEALGYFNRVLEIDPTMSEAWMGKGKAAAWQSTILNIRLNEAVIAFNHAIATADESGKAGVTDKAIQEINGLVATLYGMSRRHLEEFVALPNSWVDYLGQISQLLAALDAVRQWNPLDRTTLENIIHLCKDNIEGVSYNDPFDYNASKAWHLSPEYEHLVKERLDSAVRDLRNLDANYAPPTIEKKQAADCFVVTATMGDQNDPTVQILRRFRDDWLIHKKWGKAAAERYYKIGPSIARVIAPSQTLRALSFLFVVKPASWVARWLIGVDHR